MLLLCVSYKFVQIMIVGNLDASIKGTKRQDLNFLTALFDYDNSSQVLLNFQAVHVLSESYLYKSF